MSKIKMQAILLLFFLSSLLMGCHNDSLRPNELENTAEFTVHPKLLMDRDALLERLQYVDDHIGKEYQDKQLKQMQKDSIHQNYKKVLQNFVQEELHQEVASFQTTSEINNTRWMAVITKDKKVWTVNSYAELQWKTYPLEEKQ